jgi:hypothetical protein
MASAGNLAWLRQTGRRYIIAAPKLELKKFALELARSGSRWRRGQADARHSETDETVILCCSADHLHGHHHDDHDGAGQAHDRGR